jgi:hypothetical protein
MWNDDVIYYVQEWLVLSVLKAEIKIAKEDDADDLSVHQVTLSVVVLLLPKLILNLCFFPFNHCVVAYFQRDVCD